MPPPPRQRAPHLRPVQSHHRQPQQPPTSSPNLASQQPPANYPYESFLAQQQYSPSLASSGHSPLLEHYQQQHHQQEQLSYRIPQSHYNIPGPNSPVDGSSNPFLNPNVQSPARRKERFEAEARQQQYRLQNDDGDSVIDYYNHNPADERGLGGGLSGANLSPVDFHHGQGQHNLFWLHQQQKISQQIAAAQQRELELQLQQQGISEEYQFQEFPFDSHHPYYGGQPPQYQPHQQQDYRLHTSYSSQPPATPTSTTLSGATGSTRESIFPPGLERELSYLSVEDRATGSPRPQGFGFNSSDAVERVIEQPHYPKVPKLTSSPVAFSFKQAGSPSSSVTATSTKKLTTPPIVPTPSPKIPSKIHPNAPNPATSPPSLPPPSSPAGYEQAAQQYRQPQDHILSSSQVEEDLEKAHSGSETESEADSNSSADEEEEDEDMSTSSTPASWISSFCSLQGHEYFAEVSEEFIDDDFNLTGLSSLVPLYKESLEMILDVEPDEEDEEPSEEEADEDDSQLGGPPTKRRGERTQADMETLESQAELLYGLIHQRFITSRQGMQIMYEKYQNNHFGFCPRVFCNATKVLPCGYSDTPGVETVKLYCPSCMDMYVPPNSRFQAVDGAFFGTTFPTLFFLTFPDIEVSSHPPASISGRDLAGYKPSPSQLKKQKAEAEAASVAGQRLVNGMLENNLAPGLGRGKMYDMKIYGFKVSERAKGGPRMRWLRNRPDDVGVLDEYSKANGEGWASAEEGEEGKLEKRGAMRKGGRRRA